MKKILIVAVLIVLVGASIASVAWWYYNPQSRMNRVLSEVETIPHMKSFFLNEIKKYGCKSLVKDDFWTVEDCDSEVYYKIFFRDNSYYIGYCAVSSSVKDALQKIGPYLTPPQSCTNPSEEAQLLSSEGDVSIYKVCGLTLILRDECIVGVGE